MEQDQPQIIFNVKVNTENGVIERKAVDLEGLKDFIEINKNQFSILKLRLDQIGDEDKIYPYIARAAISFIDSLENLVDNGLGIAPKQPIEDEDDDKEVVVESPKKPVAPQAPTAPEPVKPEVPEVAETNDKIVL